MASEPLSPADVERIRGLRAPLLDWYRANQRDLPWRRTQDPYAIWISEIMLQQTRVDTVRPYFERFLARWPTVRDLAAADPDDVRAAWSGLGYYRRARLMMSAAQILVEKHDGRMPNEAAELRKLPGFGRYTAGAVASIAFDAPAAAVDGNVGRVVARVDALEGDVTKGPTAKAIWVRAEALAPGESPGALTQALIELGALVCSTRNPACELCPIRAHCRAHAEDRTHEIPPPRKRAPRQSVALTALLAVRDGHILLQQQPESGLFGGLWCLPFLEGHLEPDAALDEAARGPGWALERAEAAGEVVHLLTHRELTIRIVRVEATGDPEGLRWAPLDGLDGWAIPSVTSKCLRAALRPAERAGATLPGRRTEEDRQRRSGQWELKL